MPPVPSLTKAFSALAKPFANIATPTQYRSLSPAPAPAPTPPNAPAVPNLFNSIGSFFSNAYNKGSQILSRTVPSAPRAGVSSPSALGIPATPNIGGAAATSIAAAGTADGGRSIMGPQGAGAYVPYSNGMGGAYTPYAPNTGGSSLAPPAMPQPNATPVVIKQPVYGPSAPAIPQPSAPQTFAEPITTPSGSRVDPNTGGVVSRASALPEVPISPLVIANMGNVGSTSNYSAAAGGAPGGGTSAGGLAMPSLEDEYLKSLKATKEEEEAQKNLDELAGAAALADANIRNQPIALPFITGQLAAVERSRAARSMPIAAQLARLQAKRQMSLDFSKAALEREDKKADAGKPVVVGENSTLVDPRTGKQIYAGPGLAGKPAESTDSWVSLIKSGQASLSDVPSGLRSAVAEGLASSPEISRKSKDAISQATVVMDYIDQADGQINGLTTGAVGVASAMIPGTPAYDLARTIDTIRANVGFQALQAMRDASPTGGALGQVSEQENRLLQATLGSLDIGQGEEQLRSNMAKVRQHFSNLVSILSAGPGATATKDANGNIVISGGTSGATTDPASEGWF